MLHIMLTRREKVKVVYTIMTWEVVGKMTFELKLNSHTFQTTLKYRDTLYILIRIATNSPLSLNCPKLPAWNCACAHIHKIFIVTVVIRTNRMWKSTNRKTSCSSLDTNDPKMIDTSFESPKCKL